jgi:crystallin alpha B
MALSRFGLVPFFNDWFDDLDRIHRLVDQNFAQPLALTDLMIPSTYPRHLFDAAGLMQPLRASFDRMRSGFSEVTNDKDKFQIMLDVQQFKPEELTVKTAGNSVVVEGKHENKEDEHGYVSRHFVRKYLLPKGVKADEVQSSLSSDGVLVIGAPKHPAIEGGEQRSIPINQTERPALSEQDKGQAAGGQAAAGGESMESG